LKQSIANAIRQSQVGGSNLRVSQVHIENALKKSIAQSVRKSNVFAEKLHQAKYGDCEGEEYCTINHEHRNDAELIQVDNVEEPLFIDEKNVHLKESVHQHEKVIAGRNKSTHSHSKSTHSQHKPMKKPSCLSNFTPFVLLIGLGTHAIFEGLALGLNKEMKNVEIFALAIIMHKGAAGMSLGISMATTFPDERRFVTTMIIVFGLFTPIGVSLGIALGKSSELVEMVFACLAGGSFLYISCSEVIVEEFSVSEFRFLKLLFFIIGIGIISSLNFLDVD